jgi:hypothetical protein
MWLLDRRSAGWQDACAGAIPKEDLGSREAGATNAWERLSTGGEGHTTRGGGSPSPGGRPPRAQLRSHKGGRGNYPPAASRRVKVHPWGVVLLSFAQLTGRGSRPTRRLLLVTFGIGLVGGTLYNITAHDGWAETVYCESGQEGPKESLPASPYRHRSALETPSAIFQTVSE